ncbi:MAG: serine/threonine protein kinase, partial [Candidatus Eisenbacteria bacterium]|nr:serine/threonine protein kinase [Candidatus Eisenbacteria bacterium]
TAPVGLYLVRLGEQFPVERVDYFIASMNPALAVLLAYLAAKVVYGLSVDIVRLRQMGSYELVEILGRGGMGEVWRARHRLLARPAAIKLIPTGHLHGGGPETPELALKRFEREAQATALLRSPHTVQVYDFGTADDGAFYYVMELLEGVDAETLVERFGPQPPARVIHLMRQACDSLAEAHEHGMVHRDIKPANLMVCHHGRRHDFVKVLDFGLVGKSPHFSQATDSQLSVDQMIGGTPAYMAPEQALGRELDGRADLYALGCVGYWLATGRTVFPSGTPIETITNHIHVPPVPPSARTEVPIPPDLDRIILDCLSKSPTGRPANADELAVRLGEVVISDPWTEERARTWWRTHLPNLAGSVDPTRAASW